MNIGGAILYAITLFCALAAIIKGEAGRRADAYIWSFVAAVYLFTALMLG